MFICLKRSSARKIGIGVQQILQYNILIMEITTTTCGLNGISHYTREFIEKRTSLYLSVLRTKFVWKDKMNLQVLENMLLTLSPMDCYKTTLPFIF